MESKLNMKALCKLFGRLAVLTLLTFNPAVAGTTNSLVWKNDRVNADVRNWELQSLLEAVAGRTGWQVFAEPGLSHVASASFKNFPPGEALRSLLGNLNFALVPQSNQTTRLFVFRTDIQAATARILARGAGTNADQGKHVPNELIVRFKSKADAERWATLLGAKITGSIPDLNAYRLEFADAEATEHAREQMSNNPGVLGVDYNYYVERPESANEMTSNFSRPLTLKPKAGDGSGRVVIGLIDTAVQSMGADLDAFMLKQISVAGEAALDPNSPSHGTSMAETILRSLEFATKGSTSARILPVDVYGTGETSTTWNVAAGIVQAVNNGATILNLSLGGGTDSAVLRDLIASVSKRGIPIYAAAGNEPVSTPFYPAAYPEVTAVTALAGPVQTPSQVRIAPYANYGNFVDIAAPDANVVYFNNRQFYVRGTSAASAYTAGLAAGIFESSRRSWSEVNAGIRNSFGIPATKP
jgi:thermitase